MKKLAKIDIRQQTLIYVVDLFDQVRTHFIKNSWNREAPCAEDGAGGYHLEIPLGRDEMGGVEGNFVAPLRFGSGLYLI